MKNICHTICVTGLVTVLTVPAFAASHKPDLSKITCAEFAALDAEMQAEATKAIHMAAGEMGSDSMTSDSMSSDDASSDSMTSDSMSSDVASSDSMTSDSMASDGSMSLAKSCESHPDKMAVDVLMAK